MTKKAAHEDFTKFFETPTRETFRDLIKRNFGELDALDFKREWIPYPQLARHILAMANSGGGCIVFGMEQSQGSSIEAVGLAAMIDKADVSKGLSSYLPKRLRLEVLDFTFDAAEYSAIQGKTFQVIIVEDEPGNVPFVCVADGSGIRKNSIYARKGTASEEADDYQLQQILNRRIATGHSTAPAMGLERHVQELRILAGQCNYPDFVPDDQLSMGDRCIRQLFKDKHLLVQAELGISEQRVWELRMFGE